MEAVIHILLRYPKQRFDTSIHEHYTGRWSIWGNDFDFQAHQAYLAFFPLHLHRACSWEFEYVAFAWIAMHFSFVVSSALSALVVARSFYTQHTCIYHTHCWRHTIHAYESYEQTNIFSAAPDHDIVVSSFRHRHVVFASTIECSATELLASGYATCMLHRKGGGHACSLCPVGKLRRSWRVCLCLPRSPNDGACKLQRCVLWSRILTLMLW
jgi:hypothetical protein